MKTIILTLAIILGVSISSHAQGLKNVVYSNTEITESGEVNEYITYSTQLATPLQKHVYEKDNKGWTTTRTIYDWSKNAWVAKSRTEYKYNKNATPATISHTDWDKNTKNWSDKSELIAYVYDDEGEFLAIEKIKLDSSSSILVNK